MGVRLWALGLVTGLAIGPRYLAQVWPWYRRHSQEWLSYFERKNEGGPR